MQALSPFTFHDISFLLKIFVVTVYTPNSQRELTRLSYRMLWEDAFRGYLNGLRKKKPVIVCGDMNVAHQEIDLKNPKTNVGNAGFTDEERGKMTELFHKPHFLAFPLRKVPSRNIPFSEHNSRMTDSLPG